MRFMIQTGDNNVDNLGEMWITLVEIVENLKINMVIRDTYSLEGRRYTLKRDEMHLPKCK